MRKENSDFLMSFVSESGSFMTNRDFFGCVELEDKACYIIADGLDSDEEAHSAEMIVQTILESFLENPTLSRRRLTDYIRIAHEWLHYESRRVRLKASILIVVTDYTKIVWASAGNARLYHFRGERLILKSRDHSLAQQMADEGQIAEDKIDTNDERGNLLQYAGMPGKLKPYVSGKIPLADGDVLVMCTSGLWQAVEDAEMIDSVQAANDPVMLADTLEEVMLSKQRMRIDNYTAACIYANKTYQEEPKNRKKWIKRILIILLTVLLVGGAGIFYKVKSAAKKAELAADMLQYEQSADVYVTEQEYGKAVSDYSLGRNNSIKLKDRIHKKLLTDKMAAAQKLVDGEAHLKEGDIVKAKASYSKALELSEPYSIFKRQAIEDRLGQMTAFQKVQDWLREADLKFQNGDSSGAITLYLRARSSATENAYKEALAEITTKLETAEAKKSDVERQVSQLQADKLEAKGDRYNEAADYSGALDAYAAAQEVYQSIDMLERVLAMERKISKLEEKLNPPVPAVDPNAAGAADLTGGMDLPLVTPDESADNNGSITGDSTNNEAGKGLEESAAKGAASTEPGSGVDAALPKEETVQKSAEEEVQP